MFDTPILYLVFNRPEETALSFEKIRMIRPLKLFIASDGPRKDHKTDFENCKSVISIIQAGLDWKCEVHYLIREENLGCGRAVSQAIDWFFQHVEKGIILEDDCLPAETFFPFCAELLLKYLNSENVTHISGHNNQMGYKRGSNDYYFSRIVNIWGWATWRRAWKKYNFNFENVELLKNIPSTIIFLYQILMILFQERLILGILNGCSQILLITNTRFHPILILFKI